MASLAAGVPAETVAPAITQRQRELTARETRLVQPRPAPPNRDNLRLALEQRAAEWRVTLRSEPQVARLLLRRLVGPLTLFDPADSKVFADWETSITPAILEGLAAIQVVASLMPASWNQIVPWLRQIDGLRAA